MKNMKIKKNKILYQLRKQKNSKTQSFGNFKNDSLGLRRRPLKLNELLSWRSETFWDGRWNSLTLSFQEPLAASWSRRDSALPWISAMFGFFLKKRGGFVCVVCLLLRCCVCFYSDLVFDFVKIWCKCVTIFPRYKEIHARVKLQRCVCVKRLIVKYKVVFFSFFKNIFKCKKYFWILK